MSLLSLSLSAVQISQQFEPDHYLSYDIKTTSIRKHTVSLRDQFIDWTDFRVVKPKKLLNPTVKRHNNKVYEIARPRLHYTAFEIKAAEPIDVVAPVVVTNQFGTFTLDKFRAELLLAPSLKKSLSSFDEELDPDDEIALTADHYLCYEIPRFEVETSSGFLKDQFRGREFGRLVARRFCNPVAKIHNDKIFEIINDVQNNHLMCFDLEKERILKAVALLNQFGLKKALVFNDDQLCVPSTKIRIPEPCTGSVPDNEGICNGVCENTTDICVPTAAGICDCVPNEPQLCSDTFPDEGICNGVCFGTNEVCLPDTTNQQCRCFPPETKPCVDSTPNSDGTCNGFCENPNQQCVVDAANNTCLCLPETTTPCSFSDNGQCGGSCPTTAEVCIFVPTLNNCLCALGIPPGNLAL